MTQYGVQYMQTAISSIMECSGLEESQAGFIGCRAINYTSDYCLLEMFEKLHRTLYAVRILLMKCIRVDEYYYELLHLITTR